MADDALKKIQEAKIHVEAGGQIRPDRIPEWTALETCEQLNVMNMRLTTIVNTLQRIEQKIR